MLIPDINDLNTKYVFCTQGRNVSCSMKFICLVLQKVFTLYLPPLNVGVYSRGQEEKKGKVTSV